MPLFDPEILAQWSGGTWNRLPSEPVRGFSIDSRHLQADELFIAVRTEKRDGHAFLASAEGAGAAGAVVDRLRPEFALPQLVVRDPVRALQAMAREHRKKFTGKVIGVTGSSGKTSTKEILRQLLGRGRTHSTQANLNNYLGVPLTVLGIDPAAHAFAVVEAGINRRGEMVELGAIIAADAVVFTCIGHAHLECLGSLDGVAREKTALAHCAKEGATLVWPYSCWKYPAIAALRDSGARIFSVAFEEEGSSGGPVSPECTIATQQTTMAPQGGTGGSCRLTLRQLPFARPLTVDLPPVSRGMVSNFALALTLARALGVDSDKLVARAAAWTPPAKRGELHERAGRTYYVDCYNANPDSMRDSLEHFQQLFPEAPRCFILGGMRELGAESHRLHAEAVSSLRLSAGDRVFLVGEEATGYAEGLGRTFAGNDFIEKFATTEAIAAALAVTEGPVFLKGSRLYALERLLPESSEVTPC